MSTLKAYISNLIDFKNHFFSYFYKIFQKIWNHVFYNTYKVVLEKLFAYLQNVENNFFNILEEEQDTEKHDLLKQNKLPSFASILEILGSRQKNKFYPANPSLWVIFVSCFLGVIVILFVSILHSQSIISIVYKQFFVAVIGFVLCLTFWVSLFYKEKIYGYHTDLIRKNIMLGFWIFLFTEGLCFMSLFWTFFHSFLSASTHIGQYTPGGGIINYFIDESIVMHPFWDTFYFIETSPKLHNYYNLPRSKYTFDHILSIKFHFNLYDKGQIINPKGYPGLNTALLILSACTITASHAKLKNGRYLFSLYFLSITILIGIIFLCVQFMEIKNCTLQYNDGIYACSFYSLTGLHGIHVILGVFALILCLVNIIKGNYTRKRHDTFYCAVVYWHFVDIVWILVFLLIYCWPSWLYYSESIKYSYLGYRECCLNISTSVLEEGLLNKIIDFEYLTIGGIINTYIMMISSMENLKDNQVNIDKIFEKLEVSVFTLYLHTEFYNLRSFINYAEAKNDQDLYVFLINLLHTVAFDFMCQWLIADFTTWKGKVKFFILFILYNVNIDWAFSFAGKYTPYFLTSEFKNWWGDLLYTRKPRWMISRKNYD